MTEEEAINVLIAEACCTEKNLSCDDCPFSDDRYTCTVHIWDVSEAVRVMKEKRDDNG